MKFLLLIYLTLLTSCSSYKEFQSLREEDSVPSITLPYDYDVVWQVAIQVMQKYDLSSQSQELGVIKTRWIDNTVELNFADAFGKRDTVKSAKFKLVLGLAQENRIIRNMTKVSVYKRQMIEKDFLQGSKPERSDGITERVLLYRIKRILDIEKELRKLKEIKSKQLEDSL